MTNEALTFQAGPIVTFGYLMQVFFSLLIVIALIYAIGRYLLPRLKTTGSGQLIEVLDRVYLEPQVTAYVLKVKKETWLVVSSHKQIARIDKLAESAD